jgi:hypothetical protein
MTRGLPYGRQSRSIGQEQRGVFQIAALRETKAQLAAQLTLPRCTGRKFLFDARSQPHRRHEGQLAGALLGSPGLGDAPTETESAEEPARGQATEGGATAGGGDEALGQ